MVPFSAILSTVAVYAAIASLSRPLDKTSRIFSMFALVRFPYTFLATSPNAVFFMPFMV